MSLKPESVNQKQSLRSALWKVTEVLDRALSASPFSTRENGALFEANIDPFTVSRDEGQQLYLATTGRPLSVAAKEVFVDGRDGYGNKYDAGSGTTAKLLESVPPSRRDALQKSITEEHWTGVKGKMAERFHLGPKKITIHVARYHDLLDSS